MIILDIGRSKYVMDSIEDAELVMRAFMNAQAIDETWVNHCHVWHEAESVEIACRITNKDILSRSDMEELRQESDS